jgi:predicted MFS family arabinose efflux permease
VTIAPPAAPVLIGLNSSATYVAVSASGVIGAAVIAWAGSAWLGPVCVAFLLAALAAAVPFTRATAPDERTPAVVS